MKARELTYVAVFVALAVIFSLLKQGAFAGILVPFSMMTFVAVLAGGMIGPRLGMLSMFIYVVIGLLGVPVFETPPYGGFAYVLKPTFGFIIGFVLAAGVTGWISRSGNGGFVRHLTATFAGMFVIYLVGIPYLWAIVNFVAGKQMGWQAAMVAGFYPFILPDLVKAAIAALLSQKVLVRLRAGHLSRHEG